MLARTRYKLRQYLNPVVWSTCMWHDHQLAIFAFLHFANLTMVFASAKPVTLEYSGWSQMKRICVCYLPYQWQPLPRSVRNFSQLSNFPAHEKRKPKFLWDSQKSRSFFNFFE